METKWKGKITQQKQYSLPLKSFEIPDSAQLLREDSPWDKSTKMPYKLSV